MDGLEKADVFTDDNNQSGSSSSIELSGDSDNDHSIASDPSDDSDGDSDEKSRDGNNSHRGDEVDVQSDRAEVSGDEETREQSTERDSGKVSADADVKVQTHTVKREGIALRPNGVGSSGERKRPLKKSRAIATDATTQTTQKHSRSKPANKNKIKEEQAVAHSDDLIGNGADDDGNRQSGGESSSDEDAPLIAKIRVKGKRVGASTGDGKRSERADSAEPVGYDNCSHIWY
ncbi:hypothetical protein SARC_12718 [Sphaeroforma arctica JP610]|uniref:Uncharacterized protein n=1 Tax=Sphaeroforma arctica JP610 TaxID=667725 RepID=A0A0L0FE48_9EUKA|nr:hypothetical protein SARC_12718 [Sphaeroforma arctica JP610]KNC74741.1 hypothetical protein SARC_12718 [Sphaeroforma arctica JP610]|eukprot:XP_014148643.1 hypothetical protein SARC_12718 [Sphaeroforma arctica JP610]